MASYTVWFTDPSGNRIKPLPFVSLEYARALNDIGNLSITIPKTALSSSLFAVDCRIEVWRQTNKGRRYLDMSTPWLVQEYTETFGKESAYTLKAVSATHILQRRINAYSSDSAQAKMSGACAVLMRNIVRNNYTSQATDPLRRIPSTSFTVDFGSDVSAFITDYTCAQKNILQILQELCSYSASQGTPLFFDIIPHELQLAFQVYPNRRGKDLTAKGVMFSPERKTLYDVSVTTSYTDELNYAYALGQGQGSARLIGKASDDTRIAMSPYNRREETTDGRNAQTQAGLDAAAALAVRDGKPKKTIEGTVQDTPSTAYGDDWEIGDVAMVQAGRDVFTTHILAVNVSVQGGKETITARLKNVT